jgi:hypothetical protein
MAIQIFNRSYAKYTVEVDTRTKTISVTRDGYDTITFNIGDSAIYDSYNLYYTGTITNITDKTVTFKRAGYDTTKRIKVEEFAWRNYDYDAERIGRENAETSWYI